MGSLLRADRIKRSDDCTRRCVRCEERRTAAGPRPKRSASALPRPSPLGLAAEPTHQPGSRFAGGGCGQTEMPLLHHVRGSVSRAEREVESSSYEHVQGPPRSHPLQQYAEIARRRGVSVTSQVGQRGTDPSRLSMPSP